MRIIVTGGAGFIGSALVRHLIQNTENEVLVIDRLTYAGNLESLKLVSSNPRYQFMKLDICDPQIMQVIQDYQPDAIMNLAAESHVDRSIDGPAEFIKTNIFGTFNLLEASLKYWNQKNKFEGFRFQHISTDEVFGSLGDTGLFTETSPYDPSSPYSASKASSDHLVRAWSRTYGLPVLITNCSNNYGPYHYPEKLIPLIISNALACKPLPVYGDGLQVRDWLYVEDHVLALVAVLNQGRLGETYNVGGDSERTNLQVVKLICTYLDELMPNQKIGSHSDLITYVQDRPGHDRRYAIDCSKLKDELNWAQLNSFETGIKKTIEWFLANSEWVEAVRSNKYSGERLGIKK